VLSVKKGELNDYCHEVDLYVDGQMIGSVVYRPDDPLSCGARCWIELHHEVEVKLVTKEEKDARPTKRPRKKRKRSSDTGGSRSPTGGFG
jgi:hypothetical protein